jgi:hypothetical protein
MDPPPLSADEISHFKRWGYVIKRGYLDPELCARARDWVWTNSASAKLSVGRSGKPMDRDDEETWVGPFATREGMEEQAAALEIGRNGASFEKEYLKGGRWIVHHFGSANEFVDVLPRRMKPVAEQLLGRPVVEAAPGAPTNVANWATERGGGVHGCGMYASVPMVEGEGEGDVKRTDLLSAGIHVDGLACNLGCVGYIDDVPEDGGGFAIWPGSHRRLHNCFHNAYAVTTNDAYNKLQSATQKNQCPFIFSGKAGDVIIYHHRMFHW